MSTYATDPNVHEGSDYESGEEITVAVSRDLAEPQERLRLDVLYLARGCDDPACQTCDNETKLGPGVVLNRQEAEELARHMLNALGVQP